jgi:hypothetical protein
LPTLPIRTSIGAKEKDVPFKSTGILITYVALLMACTPSNTASTPDADFFVDEGQLFGLRVGDTVGVVTQTAVPLLRFNLVTSDSRCPADVECVTAGFATLVVTVQTALDVQERELVMPPEGKVTIEVEEMTFTFTELRPPAAEGIVIDQLLYDLTGSGEQTRDLGVP